MVSPQYRLGAQYSQMDPWVAMESNGEVSSFSQLPQLRLMEANATLGQFNQNAASCLQLAHAYRAREQIQCQWPLASCGKYHSAASLDLKICSSSHGKLPYQFDIARVQSQTDTLTTFLRWQLCLIRLATIIDLLCLCRVQMSGRALFA